MNTAQTLTYIRSQRGHFAKFG